MRLVADHELVRVAGDLADVAREPGVRLDRDRVRAARRGVPFEDRVVEAAAVPVLGQLAPELVDEQAAVREDQHAFGAGGLDEAGGGDRLARGGRVAEAVAADRAGILCDRQRLRLDLLVLELGRELLVLELVVLLGRRLVAVAVPVLGRSSAPRRSAR